MKNILTICLAAILMISADDAFAAKRAKVRRQNDPQKELKDKLNQYFISYRPSGQLVRSSAHLKSLTIDDSLKIIEVAADSHFGEQSFTPATTANIYNDILELLPDTCRQYKLKITTGGWEIGQLVANRLRQEPTPPYPIRLLTACRTATSASGPVTDDTTTSAKVNGVGSAQNSLAPLRTSSLRPS